MTLELIDIALSERHSHPRLQNRITGKVRAVLAETLGQRVIEHEIFVPVWIDAAQDTPDEDIELAMLVKAADIIGRLKSRLSASREQLPVTAVPTEHEMPTAEDSPERGEIYPPALSDQDPE